MYLTARNNYKQRPFVMIAGVVSTLAGAQLWLVGTRACADLTINSRIEVRRTDPDPGIGQSSVDVNRDVRICSHAKQARTEVDGVLTSIVDRDTVYVIDTSSKSYYKESVKDWLEVGQPMVAEVVPIYVSKKLDVDKSLDLNKSNDGGTDQKVLAGLASQKYDLLGWINVSPQPSDSAPATGPAGGSGGSNQGGSGYPGAVMLRTSERGRTQSMPTASALSDADSGDDGRIFSAVVTGDVWLSSAVPFTQDKNNDAWAKALVAAWGMGRLTSDLTKKITGQRSLPTGAEIDIRWSGSRPPGIGEPDSVTSARSSVRSQTATTSMTVSSVSDTVLDPALFALPAGYALVAPPVAPHEASPADIEAPQPAIDPQAGHHRPGGDFPTDPDPGGH